MKCLATEKLTKYSQMGDYFKKRGEKKILFIHKWNRRWF